MRAVFSEECCGFCVILMWGKTRAPWKILEEKCNWRNWGQRARQTEASSDCPITGKNSVTRHLVCKLGLTDLSPKNKKLGQSCPELPLVPLCHCVGAFWPVLSKKISCRALGLRPTQKGERVPCSLKLCLLSGGMKSSKTPNDWCYLISCWKIVSKALAAHREQEIQLTPAADRSFQAGNILVISPSRNFCAELSLQIRKHAGSGWKGNCLQSHPQMADTQDQTPVWRELCGASTPNPHLSQLCSSQMGFWLQQQSLKSLKSTLHCNSV